MSHSAMADGVVSSIMRMTFARRDGSAGRPGLSMLKHGAVCDGSAAVRISTVGNGRAVSWLRVCSGLSTAVRPGDRSPSTAVRPCAPISSPSSAFCVGRRRHLCCG